MTNKGQVSGKQIKFIPKAQSGTGIKFVPKEPVIDVPIKEVKPNLGPLKVAGGVVGGLAGMYGAGKALETAGKATYSLTLSPPIDEARAIQSYKAGLTNVKPRTAVKTALDQPLFQKGPVSRSPSSVLGQMGTRAQIGVQSEVAAKNLWKNTVQPALESSKSFVNVQDEIAGLSKEIVKFAKNDPDKLLEYKQALAEMQKSYSSPQYTKMPLTEVQELKSGLQGRTPAKFFKGKEITNAYRELQAKLSSRLTNKLHTTLSKESGKNTAKLYKDYINLRSLAKIGPKALTQARRKGGSGMFTSGILEELITPVSTTVGKVTYKAGKGLQKLPKKILALVKNAPVKEMAVKVINEMPAYLLAEKFGQAIQENTGEQGQVKDLTRALKDLRSGKKVSKGNPIAYMVKDMDKKTAIQLLEKVLLTYK